ncbi:DNA recombination protein RmuC [Reinekea marina]|uniref:DNA recombination protein RmuC n=1 Tax=Reinekea marina TaxID=1310421 RepID=A0ABV7WTV6_9GAMM|nr:DNA recombination protein RmuC [Reinekea marina]MDN3647324.1 DNA recombination protein RmuC [Reinekea marina]MDN3651080.1 DNA recombination protein RmuC [Reinekea marina]
MIEWLFADKSLFAAVFVLGFAVSSLAYLWLYGRGQREQGELLETLKQYELELAKVQGQLLQSQELDVTKQQLKKEFSLLASHLFEQKNNQFQQQSKANISAMLEPFEKQLSHFRQRVDEIHTHDTQGRAMLQSQLNQLRDLNGQLHKQAEDLTLALRGDKKLQGNWGELQLERILESVGLKNGREYQREANFKTTEGQNQRPDFVVNLPEGKHIIIDSKVTLNAYQRYVSADDEETQVQYLKQHIAAVRQHVRSLSDKNYPALEGLNAPEFVLMFMPIESAFVTAFEAEPRLFDEAFERNIVVVTPSTLLATLKTVATMWVLEKQNENASILFQHAGKIYDKMTVLVKKLEKLGQQVETTQSTWQEAMGTLRDGRGSLIEQVEKLKDLGAPTSKTMPENYHGKQVEKES